MRIRNSFIFITFAILAGCSSEQGYQTKQNRLIGLSEASLISRLGAPTKSYQMDDGKQALLYKWVEDRGSESRVRRCDTTYVLNRQKHVEAVSFVGRDCIAPEDEEEQFLHNGLPAFMEY